MAKMYGKGKTAIESEEQVKLRWQVELEFVQCLANPNYLNFLAQRGFFKDQAFINYLKYLQYWKEPEYSKYLMYPMCLYFLDMLQFEHFRREIVNSQCAKFIDDQVILMWQHYTRKRIKLLNSVHGESSINIVDHTDALMSLVTSNHISIINNYSHNNAEGTHQFNMQPQQQQIYQQQQGTPQQFMQNGIGGGSGNGPTSQQQQNVSTPMSSHNNQHNMMNGISGNGSYLISNNSNNSNNVTSLLHRT